MGHYFKYLGSPETARELWENKEALEKYLSRLRDFWDEDKQEWLVEARSDSVSVSGKDERLTANIDADAGLSLS
jgi:predicted butyrate kinase (DUF1464 family)